MCLVTDRQRAGGADGLVARVAWAARAGVHLVQVRERDLEGRALTALVGAAAWRRCAARGRARRQRALRRGARRRRARRAPQGGFDGGGARAGGGAARIPDWPFGHAREEAVDAGAAGGLDYLLFGTVFATASKPGRAPAGPAALAAVAAARVPVLAVGGVTPDNLREVAATGAPGLPPSACSRRHPRPPLRRPSPRGLGRWTTGSTDGTHPATRQLQTRRGQPRCAPPRGRRRAVAPRAEEQLELLVMLARRRRSRSGRHRRADDRVDSRGRTCRPSWPATVSAEIKARFAAKGIQPGGTPPEGDAPLVDGSPEGEEAPPDEEQQSALQRIAT